MSATAVFFLGAYIGACFGAIVMLLWCYRRDYLKEEEESRQEGQR